jgi:REP element-mobilizing transposase RayT
VYFVTICTDQQACILGSVEQREMRLNGFGRIVEEEWLRTAELRPYVALGPHQVMPNHFHGLLTIRVDARRANDAEGVPEHAGRGSWVAQLRRSLGAVIAHFKSAATRRINGIRGTPGAKVWQRGFYEHIVRSEEAYAQIAYYIRRNPAMWHRDPSRHRPS